VSRAVQVALAVAVLALALSGAAAPVDADPVPASPTADPSVVDGIVGADDSAEWNGSSTESASSAVRIERVAPNPWADGDAGEFVVVSVPEPLNTSGLVLEDAAGARAALPDREITGRVALAAEPEAASVPNDTPVRRVEGTLRLANSGDSIALRGRDAEILTAVSYERAPEGHQYVRAGERWEWRPRGATNRSPVRTHPAGARAFVLPDGDGVVPETLAGAQDRLLLAGYTLTSRAVVDELVAARERGAEVRVLLEGAPVGGISERQATALDRLVAAGVDVRVLAGERTPYRFHHAKYAVVDDRALVLTENFKPAGSGGHSSRGWGAVVQDPALSRALADLFGADWTSPGVRPWSTHRASVDPVHAAPAGEQFPTRFSPSSVPVESARLLVAPDNARSELEGLIRSAEDSVRIQQLSVDGIDDPLLQAAIDAAEGGAAVEILLSSARYVDGENGAVVADLRRLADRRDLPIEARLVEPRGRFEKVHTKGVIVDDRHVALGSLNWNPTAYGENREVVLVLTGEEVAAYYADVFAADSRSEPVWRLPLGLVGAVGAAWLGLGVVVLARIRWAA